MDHPGFFQNKGPFSIAEIAELIDARIVARTTKTDADLTDIKTLDLAGEQHISFFENKKYIENYLINHKKSLPIGEFAIGTNTLAYVISKKHNIMHVLPMLIAEKTAPHIALGDPCFYCEEDKKWQLDTMVRF